MGRRSFTGSFGFILGSQEGIPKKHQTVVDLSCIPGILSLVVTGVHLINRVGAARPGRFLSFFTFGLMVIIVIGGIGGRYVKKIRIVRDYWRTLHIPLTAIFYVTLGIHILLKTGLL